jgi:hypothetical protein
VKKLLKRRSEVEAKEFDLNEAIADAIQILSPEAKKRKVTLLAVGIQEPLSTEDHLGGDLRQRFCQEVRCAHPHLPCTKRMFDRLTAPAATM